MITILAQGEGWLAVRKPAGLPVIPPRDDPDALAPTVQRALQQQLQTRLWVVHRLDRDTSGVLLLARSAQAHRALCGLFEARRVEKVYLALCRQTAPDAPTAGRIDLAIGEGRRGAMRIDPAGKPASTRIRVRSREGELVVIEARPTTGRRHQIRVHLAARGWPLAVDRRYGSGAPITRGEARCDRLTLHAWRLSLPGEAPIVCPPPEDLAPFLGDLSGRA